MKKAKSSSKLTTLMKLLKKKVPQGKKIAGYTVPDMWNCFDYSGKELKIAAEGLLEVNPYQFYHDAISAIFETEDYSEDNNYSQSITKTHGNLDQNNWGYMGGDWIKKATMYSMHVRTSTSWDHNGSGSLEDQNEQGFKETGTFLKSIALLHLLKKMGITTVYLLPLSKYSDNFKKGEMGSPYAVKNFFALDPNLKDPMSEDAFTVEDEFAAFVEAAHILNMRVMIDIIPRTASRDNELIAEHPDWFYWIRTADLENYNPPFVDGVPQAEKPSFDNLWNIYHSGQVWEHMRKFVASPDRMDIGKWEWLKSRVRENPELDLFELIQQEYGITTAPAFSDGVNDPQPPWTDVTFLRLYLDHPAAAKHYLNTEVDNIQPYILFDVIKSNIFKGEHRNEELWNMLSGVIPFYQEQFGIDGARIDMGHALPEELVHLILQKPREIDPDFSFIAEEVLVWSGGHARYTGYNMIIGDGYYNEPRLLETKTHQFFYEAPWFMAPVFATAETPDTPRISARPGGRQLARFVTALNHFMPNGVPFINSGMELYETQPMNTGLDCAPDERFRLFPDDPYYGKLAFFEKFQFHWTLPERWEMAEYISVLGSLRSRFIGTLGNIGNYTRINTGDWTTPAIAFGYVMDNRRWHHHDNLLIIVANTDLAHSQSFTLDLGQARHESGNLSRKAWVEFSNYGWQADLWDFDDKWNLHVNMNPGEVRVIIL